MKRALLFLFCALMSAQIFAETEFGASFPTLWGLQQTICSGYYGEEGDEWASGLTGPSQEITMMDGKPYLQWGSWYLREENDKILVYSEIQKKDLVLYDFTLELGDTLTTLNLVTPEFLEYEGIVGIVDYPLSDYDYTYPIDTLVVTELSKETLLDGKEYTRWKFSDGTVYVEGIGSMSETFFHHIEDHLPVPVSYLGSYLVCVSKNNKLLYQMDDAEMERLGAECLCEYNAEQKPEDLFPTLWGLQRTHTIEMYDHAPSDGKRSGGYPLPFASVKDTVINGKTYLQFGDYVNGSDYSLFFLREENNKVLIYSSILQEDLVLYDYTLKLGDSLPAITSDHDYFSDDHFTKLDKAENIFTYVVTDVSTVTLLDGIERKKWILKNKYLPIIEYVEGIGCYGENTSHSGDFFRLIENHPYTTEYVGDHLVCVSKNGQLLYSMTQEEMNSFTLTCECLSQEDTIDPKDLFPTLWGLQRTEVEFHTDGASAPSLVSFNEYTPTLVNGKWYLYDGRNYLREENNQVLLHSPEFEIYEDIVLYDWTLEVGDTLPYHNKSVYRESDYIVTDVSTITLLDGKEYKKWTLACGIEYIEGIGAINGEGFGNYFCIQHTAHPATYIDTRLVCASRNGQLLYQMDEAEMERLGAECLCDVETSYKSQWCDTWNVLYHGWDPEGGDDPYMPYTFIYQLEEDTTINDLTYQRLTGRFSLSTMPSNKEYVAALRFAENKKVFVHYDNTEYLLYDFGAQVGDTLEIFGGIDHYMDFKTLTHVITEIDSLDDGRLQIYSNAIIQESEGYETPFERLYPKIWIEGVGSKDGIVQNSATNRIGSGTSVLLCAYHNDDCIYTTDNPYYTPYGCVHNDSFFTATEEVNAPTQSVQKIMYNGQLLILRDGKTYNVMGIELTK